MNDSFDIPVTYKNEELAFKAKLLQFGYTHKFEADVYGITVLFEPDEERNYRAVIDPLTNKEGKKIDVELLKSIAQSLESLRK